MATSATQTLTNQANATHSTGPRTAAGKARSSSNSLTHGATSRRPLFGTDDTEDQYLEFELSVLDHYQPSSQFETVLACKVASTAWRHQRVLSIESDFYTRCGQVISPPTSDDGIPAPYIDPEVEHTMRLLQRYVTAAIREWRQAIRELETVQAVRCAREAEEEVPVAVEAVEEPITQNLTRTERRAIERAQRKAARREATAPGYSETAAGNSTPL